MAATQGYFLTTVNGSQPATWEAVTEVCWDQSGIVIFTNNTDYNIFQTCEECECNNFEQGDVAEAFLAPVSDAYAIPSWYYELDVGAKTGAFWGGIVHNSLGNDTVYSSAFPCDADPGGSGFASCKLNCTDTGGLVGVNITVNQGEGWWTRTMRISWVMFDHEYTPAGNGGQPWAHWRGNFYRYSYPHQFEDCTYNSDPGDNDAYELSGWSPTHNPSFHRPEAFGTLTFMPSTVNV